MKPTNRDADMTGHRWLFRSDRATRTNMKGMV